jgi:hypothetical protein
MRYVRLTKLCQVDNPELPAEPWETHVPGVAPADGKTVPVSYSVIGWLTEEPTNVIGGRFIMLREWRNGVQRRGIFESGIITAATCDSFATVNGIWRIEELEKPATLQNWR